MLMKCIAKYSYLANFVSHIAILWVKLFELFNLSRDCIQIVLKFAMSPPENDIMRTSDTNEIVMSFVPRILEPRVNHFRNRRPG